VQNQILVPTAAPARRTVSWCFNQRPTGGPGVPAVALAGGSAYAKMHVQRMRPAVCAMAIFRASRRRTRKPGVGMGGET